MLKQGDLFWGMNLDFVKKVTDIAVNVSCSEGDKVFDAGDRADYFYVLLKGSVMMERGQGKWYHVKNPGEIFGWSALISRDDYAASAACTSPTELLKIQRGPFLKIMDTSLADKAILYEKLAKMLGNQLLSVYLSTSC